MQQSLKPSGLLVRQAGVIYGEFDPRIERIESTVEEVPLLQPEGAAVRPYCIRAMIDGTRAEFAFSDAAPRDEKALDLILQGRAVTLWKRAV